MVNIFDKFKKGKKKKVISSITNGVKIYRGVFKINGKEYTGAYISDTLKYIATAKGLAQIKKGSKIQLIRNCEVSDDVEFYVNSYFKDYCCRIDIIS